MFIFGRHILDNEIIWLSYIHFCNCFVNLCTRANLPIIWRMFKYWKFWSSEKMFWKHISRKAKPRNWSIKRWQLRFLSVVRVNEYFLQKVFGLRESYNVQPFTEIKKLLPFYRVFQSVLLSLPERWRITKSSSKKIQQCWPDENTNSIFGRYQQKILRRYYWL